MLKKLGLLLCSIGMLLSYSAHAVVILQYHHVSDTTPKSTSVTPAQFAEQMAYLADNDFNVVSITDAVEAIKFRKAMPAKSIVITFDDGYDNIINNAAPILDKYQFPYTVFVAAEPIAAGYKGMMSWQQIRELAQGGATIANHTWEHEHLIRKLDGESDSQWLQRVEKSIVDTEEKILKETGQSVKMLAYPYGEYNSQVASLIKDLGYIGFGQQSGAAGPHSILTALPRFPVAHAYADINELKVKFTSLNMPVITQNKTDPLLEQGQWRPRLTVKLDMSDIHPHQLMCFVQGQGANKPEWLNEDEFTIQAVTDLPAGRSRYNCTAPSKSGKGYYWFSQAWVRPKNDGTWVAE
ncbi:polysaccharide deacetylase family protein [Shewanella sp. WXL01]|uniref:Polysaccharide deacetylase n=1 Tax=Shewanella maritima TaxID=2520507 RepID=A0A411PIH7_9GAMM|nr:MULTISPECIES: polysaccharide deacetylase family protein [Shewanella]NKF52134.1 polysaccharide deacetylase family protein [Shewanella sp. WXL01]QBF83399.1 polysaccharide deacetylase [Shewanella maritima]